jgi:hypothetical protein
LDLFKKIKLKALALASSMLTQQRCLVLVPIKELIKAGILSRNNRRMNRITGGQRTECPGR